MRTLLSGMAFVAIGVSAMTHAAPFPLKGSDTLEDVTNDVIGVCSLGALLSYSGGGSGTGEAAMVSGTQQMAPMSRELGTAAVVPLSLCNLNVDPGCTFACTPQVPPPPATPTSGDTGCTDSAPSNGKRVACDSSKGASELLIGLDGIAIVTSNQVIGDSLDSNTPGDPSDDCTDSVSGGNSLVVSGCTATDGCSTPGTYTFTSWKDVLAMVYGGQNHTTATQLLSNGTRNPARINCAGAVRQTLVNNWASMFSDGAAAQTCRADSCLKLKHAFRRGDQSGTTDTFVGLVGLVAIPPFTTTFANLVPTKDSKATANPFCNAGEGVMNKGDSDYLDLDPIRRIADSDTAAALRVGIEQVAEGYLPITNPPTTLGVDNRTEPPVVVLADYASSTEPSVLPDPNIPNALALEQAALTMRKGLGVVLVIEIPSNFTDEITAYFSTVPQFGEPALCASGKFAPSLVDGQHTTTAICPDGSTQPCLLPANLDNPSTPNFNCLNNSPVPASPPLRDSRVYNLLVVNSGGKYVRDNYVNPNLPVAQLSAARQNRVVSAFYRLHVTQTDSFGATPTGINCKKFTSTDQIGCLVAASPCSIGFAGREAVDGFTNMAFEVEGIRATSANITNLVNGSGGAIYPIARRLWVNASNGLGSVTGDQRTLLQCFEGLRPGVSVDLIDSIVQSRNFVPVPLTRVCNRNVEPGCTTACTPAGQAICGLFVDPGCTIPCDPATDAGCTGNPGADGKKATGDAGCTGVAPKNGKIALSRQKSCPAVFP